MALSEIFFLAIIFYLLYRFVFNFFLPIFRTTRQVREQFRHMHENQQGSGGTFQHSYSRPNEAQPKRPEPSTSQSGKGEYIDFEEVK